MLHVENVSLDQLILRSNVDRTAGQYQVSLSGQLVFHAIRVT
jgi:hypothetical protein